MRGAIDFVESETDDRDYDRWLNTLTGASKRLDDLQTAVTEVRYLRESGDASANQVLKVLSACRIVGAASGQVTAGSRKDQRPCVCGACSPFGVVAAGPAFLAMKAGGHVP
jgi:hypothetical protein